MCTAYCSCVSQFHLVNFLLYLEFVIVIPNKAKLVLIFVFFYLLMSFQLCIKLSFEILEKGQGYWVIEIGSLTIGTLIFWAWMLYEKFGIKVEYLDQNFFHIMHQELNLLTDM